MEERTPYKLKEPIQFGSEQIDTLNFRKPRAKDFRVLPLEGQTMGHILDLVAKLCAQPPAVIDLLGSEDLKEVSRIVGNFLPTGPATGNEA